MLILEREMTLCRDDLLRALQFAFPGAVEARDEARDGALKVGAGGTALEIDLTELPERRIGQLRLPRLAVRLRISGGTPQDQQALLARLDLALQRGGG